MRLRNKKTGVIGVVGYISTSTGDILVSNIHDQEEWYHYKSLAELNAEWEDYEEPKRKYWFVTWSGDVDDETDDGFDVDKCCKEIGNYFETKEEAEKAVRKLKAWKRLKDNGFKIKGWKFTPDMKQIKGNYVKIEAEIPQILINEKDLDLLFCPEENI